jgi:hypothetical protein
VSIAGLTAWHASNGDYVATALGVLGALGTSINAGVIGKGAAPTVLALLLVTGCGGPLKAAAGTTLAVAEARNVTDSAIALAFERRMDKCKGDGYKACIEASTELKAMAVWRTKARPAVNASIIATEAALRLWQMSGDKPKWMDYLRPAVCGVIQIVAQFGDMFPANGKPVLALLDAAKGVSCD